MLHANKTRLFNQDRADGLTVACPSHPKPFDRLGGGLLRDLLTPGNKLQSSCLYQYVLGRAPEYLQQPVKK